MENKEPSLNFCPTCGRKVQKDFNFCINCGRDLRYINDKTADYKEKINVEKETKTIEKDELKGEIELKIQEDLFKWRKNRAEQDGYEKQVYIVLQNKTINEICKIKPTNRKELKKVKGIGKINIKKYGDEILEIVSKYKDTKSKERNIDNTKRDITKLVKKRDCYPEEKTNKKDKKVKYQNFIKKKDKQEIKKIGKIGGGK